jgi:putative ABC transport system permease protein
MVSGIVVSVALTAAMAIMVHSFRVSLDGWLTGVLEADLFARAAPQGDAVVFSPDAQAKMAAVAGVERIDPIRFERLTPEGTTGLLTIIARPTDAQLLRGFQADPPVVPPKGAAIMAWVSEAAVDLFGWKAGQEVTVPISGKRATFRIAGVFRDYSRTWGALLVDLADYRAIAGDALANDIAIHLKAGADAKAVEAALGRIVAQVPGAELHDASFIHGRALAIFDRTFAATYALEAAAILIALAGVTSSFAALAWSRRREFGVLRHLGLSRGEVIRLLSLEGGAAGIIGAILGLLSGAAVSVVLVHVVNRQSFHWGMAIHWPWLALFALSGSVILLCALGASAAGRAAVAREAVEAVKDDA